MNDLFGPGSNFDNRFVADHAELKERVGACRKLSKKIVLTSGAWDILHIGHCGYLEAAKKSTGSNGENTVLIVGVDSDEKIRAKKGKSRPIVPEKERMGILCHIRHVDLVVLKNQGEEKWALIKAVKPDILVISERTEYSEDERNQLKEWCGEIVVLESQATTSTTAKIRLLIVGVAREARESFNKLEKDILDILSEFKNFLDQLPSGVEKSEDKR